MAPAGIGAMTAMWAGSQGRLTGWRAALIWLVAASGIVAIALAQIWNPADWVIVLIIAEVMVSFVLVGSVLVVRLPENPIGWLLWASGAGLGWAAAGVAYGNGSVDACGGCFPATVPIALLANATFAPVLGTVGIFIPLLFPDGRLPSPAWRPLAWFAVASIAMFTAMIAFTPGDISDAIPIENPIGFDGFGGLSGLVGLVTVAMVLLSMVLALVSVIWRFRHAGSVQRQQLRWFGYASLLMVAAVAIGIGLNWDSGWVVMFTGLGLMPLATGVAILRYRLYDLDRLVSRTIAYAAVTALLVLTYASLILLLEGPMGTFTNGDTLTVALSTLAVAALFTPVRRRVQRVVDRRFDRARYDAERTTAAFSDRLRDEVDLATVTADLDGTVRRAMAPASMGVWLRSGSAR